MAAGAERCAPTAPGGAPGAPLGRYGKQRGGLGAAARGAAPGVWWGRRIGATEDAVQRAYEAAAGAGSFTSRMVHRTDVRDLGPQLERQGMGGFEQRAHRTWGGTLAGSRPPWA